MSYIDGFVIAVPTANKHKFIAHARDKPCTSCTSLIDGFDRAWYSVTRNAAFAAIAKAPAERIPCMGETTRLVSD